MAESLKMLLMISPAMATFIAYLYAADKLDGMVRNRFPEEWKAIVGKKGIHSSSNALRLVRNGRALRSLKDAQIARQLDLIRYIFWAFALAVFLAFLFA